MKEVHPIENLGSVLWDIPQEQYGDLPDDFIIRRVLTYGTVSMMLSLKKHYGQDRLREVFDAMPAGNMHPRRHAYVRRILLV